MAKSESTKLLSQPIAFRAAGEVAIVYVNNVPDIRLTQLYRHIWAQQSDAVATYAVRLLYAATQHLQDRWVATTDNWRQGIEALLAQHYGVDVQARSSGQTRLYCGVGVSASTINTVLARLNTACNAAIDLGWRHDTPLARAQLRRPHLRSSPAHRQSAGRYLVYAGSRADLHSLIANDRLPDQLREAADRLRWPVRDRAILEILLCTGARVSEIVGMRWAGYDALSPTIWLQSKGSRGQLVKTAQLSDRAKALLEEYVATDRTRVDPLHRLYSAYRPGRPWSPEAYSSFLRAPGRDPLTVPIFFSARGTPYTVPAFRETAWGQLAEYVRIRPHQIRYWFINQRLGQLLQMHNTNEYELLLALHSFVNSMGWKSWEPLRTYDLCGMATTLLARYDRRLEQLSVPTITHGGTHTTDRATALARAASAGVIPLAD